MSELSRLTKAHKKFLGLVDTKQGVMVDNRRLGEIKKFQRKSTHEPKVKTMSVKDMVQQTINKSDIDKGLY